MKKNDPKDTKPLSPEEQLHEARQDKSGRIRRYLELAEKLLGNPNGDDGRFPSAA